MGRISYTVWSDVFVCRTAPEGFVFWEVAVDKEDGRVRDRFTCPHCGSHLTKRSLERAMERVYDQGSRGSVLSRQVPVLINYSVGGKAV